jgi:hypothetical protein
VLLGFNEFEEILQEHVLVWLFNCLRFSLGLSWFVCSILGFFIKGLCLFFFFNLSSWFLLLFRFLLSRLSFNHFLLDFWLILRLFHLLLLSLLLKLFFDLVLDLFFDKFFRLFLSLCLFGLLDLYSYGRLLLFKLGLSLHGFRRVCYRIWLGCWLL